MDKIAVIPAYEPDSRMISLLKELRANKYIIIVVNDGSGNKYDNIFESAIEYATVLRHKINMGKGRALKTAFSYIKDNYDKYSVITLDCDGQHKVRDANKLYEYLINNKDDLVIGMRIRSDKTPIRSKIGNSITRSVFNLVTGIDIYDTQTGLRGFTDRLMDFMLNIEGERFEYEINMLLMCARNNIKIKEIEIETIYYDNNSKSHFKTIRDSYKVYRQIFRFSCVSFISFIIDYILFVIFNIISNNLLFSNILSRLVSSFINYNMNKRVVFKNNNKYSFIKYYLLALVILLFNSVLLNIFVDNLLLNKYVSKIIVEIILFILSFIVQKFYVFKRK